MQLRGPWRAVEQNKTTFCDNLMSYLYPDAGQLSKFRSRASSLKYFSHDLQVPPAFPGEAMSIAPHNVTSCFVNYQFERITAAFFIHQHHIKHKPKRTTRLPTMESRPLSKAQLGRILGAACRADHVPFVTRCISMAQLADSQVTVQEVLQEGLKRATNHAAMNCLHYVLELGADVRQLPPH